jgi:hypothetical protein
MSRLDWQRAVSPTSIDESGTDYYSGSISDGRFVAIMLCFSFPEATQVDAVSTAVLLRRMAVALTTSSTKRWH